MYPNITRIYALRSSEKLTHMMSGSALSLSETFALASSSGSVFTITWSEITATFHSKEF